MSQKFILRLDQISKHFSGIKALDQVDFQLKKGEVHALIGENGAGKSTLMNIIGGVYQPDEGQIWLKDQEVKLERPHTAKKSGISIVYQELSLAENLSIAENIYTYNKPLKIFNFINWKQIYASCGQLLSLFDKTHLHPKTLVEDCSVADKQVVEILKAISSEPDILVLDEPTASLTKKEVDQLFALIRHLKEKGTAIIYISHHMKEIFQIADRVTILRDGTYVSTDEIGSITERDLVTMMVGREIDNIYGRSEYNRSSAACLKVEKLTSPIVRDISFSLQQGEILGFYGLVGAGRTELAKAIFGLDEVRSGNVILYDNLLHIKNPGDAINNGIAYMSEDRKISGLFLEDSIRANIIAPQLFQYQKRGFMINKKIDEAAVYYKELTKMKAFSIEQPARTLSGGNQQKLLLAMWLQIKPSVLIIDEPTKGVDIGARKEIYQIIRNMAKSGIGFIIISSDLPECLGLSDRILVMKDRQFAAEFQRGTATEENVVGAATGVAM